MTIRTVELGGERYVIVPEKEFRNLQRQADKTDEVPVPSTPPAFRKVTPLKVDGIPASEILIRDRR